MHRFFVPAEWLAGGNVTVSGPLVHQMRKILRLHAGEHVMFLDNSGWEMEAELTSLGDDAVQAVVRRKTLGTGEPRTKITLYQSLLKGDHVAQVLEQCTQIGVVEFVPIVTERCIIGDADRSSERAKRWQRIITEAAEQAGRSKLPALRQAVLLSNALEAVGNRGLSFMPWEEEHKTTLHAMLGSAPSAPPPDRLRSRSRQEAILAARRPFSINLFLGPEGGFTAGEVAIARHYGVIPITLGARSLRADTAGVVAASIILHEMGDMT